MIDTQIFGYVGAIFIGLVLGLLGGGGSILTLPILVYLFHLNPVTATAYSLFVVGTTSLTGAINNYRKKLVELKTGLAFAFPAFVVVYCVRKYLIHLLPDIFYQSENFQIHRDFAIMTFFGLIMAITSTIMIRSKADAVPNLTVSVLHYPLLFLQGILVGLIAGLIGAGGGFLIIPALVWFGKLPMKRAIATSLLIIAVNSLIGFLGDIQNIEIDWQFLLLFTFLSIIGIFIGMYFSNKVDGKKLKRWFGWFVLSMAVFILIRELTLTM